MPTRVQAPKSPVYHLQAQGHRWQWTMCGRQWVRYERDEMGDTERIQVLREVPIDELSSLRLCGHCRRDLEWRYAPEIATLWRN